MSQDEFTPVVRVELRRADVPALIRTDEVLRRAPLVQCLGGGEPLGECLARRFPANMVIFQQREAGDSLFFVLRGEVRLYVNSGTETVELGRARPGEIFGEDDALEASGKRSSSAVTAGDVDLVELPRAWLAERLKALPALAAHLGDVRQQRRAAVAELTSFLSKW